MASFAIIRASGTYCPCKSNLCLLRGVGLFSGQNLSVRSLAGQDRMLTFEDLRTSLLIVAIPLRLVLERVPFEGIR